jgi:hypothetical protein
MDQPRPSDRNPLEVENSPFGNEPLPSQGTRNRSRRLSSGSGPKSNSSHPVLTRQRKELVRQSAGIAAVATLQPAALVEKAGKTIRPGPTRKHGAAVPV